VNPRPLIELTFPLVETQKVLTNVLFTSAPSPVREKDMEAYERSELAGVG
tara:strand:+ start:1284 stop:1433 length:150 start_codon:yes stop_codon:yes gene_type:complete